MSEPALSHKVIAIDKALDQAQIPHAFGGALALAYYAEPRATVDVDVNLFIPPAEHEAVRAALGPLGVDPARASGEEIERDGQGRWWWGRNPVDLFFAYDPVHDAMASAARTVPFAGTSIRILSPEHLVVCKAMFDRSKDWIDIEQVLAATPDLDSEEIGDWLERMVGGDNQRAIRFADLAARNNDHAQ
jgi:hypothetical protein